MFTITLNVESAAVLLRCLASGQIAVSLEESKNGVAEKIDVNCELLRKQVCDGIVRETLTPSITTT